MSVYNLKGIQTVPTANEFIDIVLSKTMRKTPTVVHKSYQISRIRAFYMRKVKYTQQSFEEKLEQILTDFPKLDDVHPFYSDLINVLYDRDHYKIALGHIFAAKNLISGVGRDYVRLLKFGDSLYRCKQLKRAALGRMATIMKKQKETLAYLEQVRQHLARLPAIDPNTRTLLICGYPNCGKSSFINKLTRAEVDVQPYAFTTKSLFVGHMDYKYLRWQVIDTPGILDHPLEERNTIEMLSITALAHLRSCILYFMDLSEECGYSIKLQASLFKSIQPLFANKPLVLVFNKSDKRTLADLSEDEKLEVDQLIKSSGVEYIEVSCFNETGLMEAKQLACDKLLAARVESKLRQSNNKVGDILDRIHVAMPVERDDTERQPFIPPQMAHKVRQDVTVPEKVRTERDIEVENGGAGVYNIDLKKKYILASDEWKHDIIPEIMDGHNVADFIDPEIAAKLEALEREEEGLVDAGHYAVEGEVTDPTAINARTLANKIKEKRKMMVVQHRMKTTKQTSKIGLKARARLRSASEIGKQLQPLGLDTVEAEESARGRKRTRSITQQQDEDGDVRMGGREVSIARSMSKFRSIPMRDRSVMGLRDNKQKSEVTNIKKLNERRNNMLAKAGEADRVILTSMPKHLFAGKRKNGKTDRR
ncbi:hypothetical protein MIR68_006179 [Amoeboaphelidium protococcarum]|nr:hypothetical protein MIR68_006179 [Amoeboaphelidium protococcarum]